MSWRNMLMNSFSRSLTDSNGERLDFDVVARVVNSLDADTQLSTELANLEEEDVHRRFLELYGRMMKDSR